MNILEARINGQPGLASLINKMVCLLPRRYELLEGQNGIVGAINLDTHREIELVWRPIGVGDSLEILPTNDDGRKPRSQLVGI